MSLIILIIEFSLRVNLCHFLIKPVLLCTSNKLLVCVSGDPLYRCYKLPNLKQNLQLTDVLRFLPAFPTSMPSQATIATPAKRNSMVFRWLTDGGPLLYATGLSADSKACFLELWSILKFFLFNYPTHTVCFCRVKGHLRYHATQCTQNNNTPDNSCDGCILKRPQGFRELGRRDIYLEGAWEHW